MIKAVVFDLDGVLLDSEIVNILAAVKSFKEESAYKLSKAEQEYVVGRHPLDFVPYISARHSIPFETQKQILTLQPANYYSLWDKSVKLMPGVKYILTWLKNKGITLALATSSNEKNVYKFMKQFALENIFSLIITKEDVNERKPSPQIYILAKKKLKLPTNEILVVEDTQIGVESAKGAKLICIAIPNKYTIHQDFTKADYVLNSLKQITNLI